MDGVRSVQKFVDEDHHAIRDRITNLSNFREVFSAGILQFPVLVALARVDRARVTTAHGHNDVGVATHLVGQLLRRLIRDVDAQLLHRLDDHRIQHVAGIGSGGVDDDSTFGHLARERRRHLRASCVVHAEKENVRGFRFAYEGDPPGTRACVTGAASSGVKLVKSAFTSAKPTTPPTISAPTNRGAEAGAMPANEFENMRPTTMAGLAKLVELVKK